MITWLKLNLVSILGITQAIIKLAKEIVTAIINILFPVIPNKKFQIIVLGLRKAINAIDLFVEKGKSFLLKKTNLL